MAIPSIHDHRGCAALANFENSPNQSGTSGLSVWLEIIDGRFGERASEIQHTRGPKKLFGAAARIEEHSFGIRTTE